ncbi:MAG: biotin/lipoyl-containing protein [Cutibacterium avidum]|nr:biotin/lipoyl-containing protein [Cutibacterium avidum]
MSTEVTLPALGESVTEGTVSRWLKAVGDTVEADEPLLEVSTRRGRRRAGHHRRLLRVRFRPN